MIFYYKKGETQDNRVDNRLGDNDSGFRFVLLKFKNINYIIIIIIIIITTIIIAFSLKIYCHL